MTSGQNHREVGHGRSSLKAADGSGGRLENRRGAAAVRSQAQKGSEGRVEACQSSSLGGEKGARCKRGGAGMVAVTGAFYSGTTGWGRARGRHHTTAESGSDDCEEVIVGRHLVGNSPAVVGLGGRRARA
jgi:hypothetical protein